MLTFSSVDKVGGDVATVKLHAFNDLQLIMQSFAILYTHTHESKIKEMFTKFKRK